MATIPLELILFSLLTQTRSSGHGGRPDVIIVGDETIRPENCPFGYMHVIDVRHEPNPVQIGTFRLPLNRFCPPDRPGRRFGIHDVERMIKGNIVFSAWENSGFWAIDISDPYHPKAVGHFVASAEEGSFLHLYRTAIRPSSG